MKPNSPQVVPSKRRILISIGSTWTFKLVSLATTVVVTGVATRTFGLEAMGAWTLVATLASALVLLDFGASTALPRLLPRLQARKQSDAVQEVVLVSMASTAVVGLILIFAAPWICDLFISVYRIPTGYLGDVRMLALVCVVTAGVSLPLRLSFGLLSSIHRLDLYFAVETLGAIVKLVLLPWLLLQMGVGLGGFGFANLLVPVAIVLIQFGISGFFYDFRGVLAASISWLRFRQLLQVCAASVLVTIANLVVLQGPVFIVGAQKTVAAASLIGFPIMIVSTVMSFAGSLPAFLTPIASAMSADSDKRRLTQVTMSSIQLSGAGAVISGVAIVLIGETLITLWLGGPRVHQVEIDEMALLMTLIVPGFVVLVPGSMCRAMLFGIGRHRIAAVAEACCAALTLALMAVVQATSASLSAFAGALSAGLLLRGLVVLPLMAARSLGFRYLAFFKAVLATPLWIGAATLATGWAIQSIFASRIGWIQALVTMSMSTAVWLWLTWRFQLDDTLRNWVLAQYRRQSR